MNDICAGVPGRSCDEPLFSGCLSLTILPSSEELNEEHCVRSGGGGRGRRKGERKKKRKKERQKGGHTKAVYGVEFPQRRGLA